MNIHDRRLAMNYAKALLDQAQIENNLATIHHNIKFIRQALQNNTELVFVLKSPVISRPKKLTIITKLFASHIHPLTLRCLLLINNKGNSYLLEDIIDAFFLIYDQIQSIVTAAITTTFKLPADLLIYFQSCVKTLVHCKEVHLSNDIDPSIQGGFILKVNDQQLDNSLQAKYSAIRKKFSMVDF